ncbi:MAG TPA: hypothetical protein VHP83_21595, partial [Aggregatilineaceae bacterium]|nr:hypothetical protein [Aggregatilineaceae bacterium]
AVLATILFASLNIIRNLQNYDHPLGPKDFVDTVTMSPSSRVRMTAESMAHYSYQMVDFSGLPPHVASLLHQIKAGIAGIAPEGKSLTFDVDEVGPSLHEDTAWFGPLGAFLLVPVILLYSFKRWRKAEPYTISLLVLFWSFLIVLSASETWTPFKGRYIVLVITLTAPFFAALLKPNDYAKKAVWGIVALALLIILWTTTHNELKPFVGSEPIWGEDRASNQTRGNRSVEPVIRIVEQRVNDGTTLGLLLGGDDWNYPLFGERFERELVQIYPYSRIQDCEWLQAQQIDFVLINPTYFREALPAHLAEIDRANGYILAKSVCSG